MSSPDRAEANQEAFRQSGRNGAETLVQPYRGGATLSTKINITDHTRVEISVAWDIFDACDAFSLDAL
jgi:hypothetical protein